MAAASFLFSGDPPLFHNQNQLFAASSLQASTTLYSPSQIYTNAFGILLSGRRIINAAELRAVVSGLSYPGFFIGAPGDYKTYCRTSQPSSLSPHRRGCCFLRDLPLFRNLLMTSSPLEIYCRLESFNRGVAMRSQRRMRLYLMAALAVFFVILYLTVSL